MSNALTDAAAELSNRCTELPRPAQAAFIYNPLVYAWEPHRRYLERFGGQPKRALLLGMNPGPWGMAQTGVPFGELPAVRDWMGLSGTIDSGTETHPKKPIQGWDCPRSEVSGRRLWGLMKERFGTPEAFFADHFVANYCPLIFLDEGGRNLTPDKLPQSYRRELNRCCDDHLKTVLTILQPEYLIGIGKYAEKRLKAVVDAMDPEFQAGRRIAAVLHPSPASPLANKGWAAAAEKQFREMGLW